MKVKELVERLNSTDTNEPVVLYFLTDYNLQECELETILELDGRIELTIKPVYSDDGGNTLTPSLR